MNNQQNIDDAMPNGIVYTTHKGAVMTDRIVYDDGAWHADADEHRGQFDTFVEAYRWMLRWGPQHLIEIRGSKT